MVAKIIKNSSKHENQILETLKGQIPTTKEFKWKGTEVKDELIDSEMNTKKDGKLR